VTFLKGPISWAWLSAAMALPGKALHVGILLWLERGLHRSTTVSISLSSMSQVGVSRSAASRGLANLENAGLVTVERHSGRKPRVTIVDIDG
jgi:DNA-binding transcriptional ArsR family regulator